MKKQHLLRSAAAIALAGSMIVSMAGCGNSQSISGHLVSISNNAEDNLAAGTGSTIGTRADLEPAVDSTGMFSTFPEDVPEDVRDWPTGDEFMSEYSGLADQITGLLSSSGNEQQVLDLCDQLDDLYMNADAWYVFCCIDAEADPDTYGSEESSWDYAYSWMFDKDWDVYHAVLTSEYADALIADDNLSDARVEYYTNEDNGISDELYSLNQQENTLIAQYDEIAGTYGSYSSVSEYNSDIYDIYSQLVAVRQQIAVASGYDSYDDYAYAETYGRDFTPDDVDAYYQNVVNYWVPVTDEFDQLVSEYGLSTSGGPDLSDEDITNLMHTMASGICDDYNELEQYMEDQDLLTLGTTSSNTGGVTIQLDYYDSAAIFAGGSDGLDLLSTALHEFGHYANDCLAPDTYDNYDVSEVHSTGMQVLSTWFARQTLGEYAQDYTAQQLDFLLWYVGSQAATDAFERAVYDHYAETGNMYSFDELCQLYQQYFTECGNKPSDNTMWTEDSFLFESPCYSLSYSISAATSLSMLSGMEDDFSGTLQKYLNLVAETDAEGYVAAMEQAGMPNVLEATQSQQTAEAVIEYARNFCAGESTASD